MLNVKDNPFRYFEAYDKREIYGNSQFREELSIEIN